MSSPYQGYGNIGEALFGGGGRRGDAFNQGATQAAQLETLLAKARQERDQASKRAQFRQTLEQQGIPAEQAAILDVVFGAGYDPTKLSGYQGDQQRMGFLNEGAGAARSGDLGLLNNMMTLISGKPRERTNITQGMAFDPYAAPDQAMQTTPVGLADIGATEALRRQRDASAGADYALAGLRNRTDPNIRSGGGGGGADPAIKPGGPLTADTMAMFSRIDPRDPSGEPSLDQAMFQQFLEWQQSTGNTGNINDAARQWLVESKRPGFNDPRFIDPLVPSSMGIAPPAPAGAPMSLPLVAAGRPAPPQSMADTSQLEADLRRDGAPEAAISEIVRSVVQGRDFNVQAPVQAQQKFTAQDAQQALADAREAIRRGVISPEEAKRRLREAGMTQTAEFIR